ncbi:MAG: ABC transporter substrate-binding protein [Bacteroides sp.]|nr:ABC transporter substrate-binding protein [Bacteroides sp.]
MRATRHILTATTLSLVVTLLLQACGSSATTRQKGRAVEFNYAVNLTMEEFDGYTIARIRNPWDTLKTLQTYVLLNEGTEAPAGFTSDQIINVPLNNSVIYSSIHAGLIKELGAPDAITGVCDAEYIYDPLLRSRIDNGNIADCGSSMQPNIERIIKLAPGAVLLSPFENATGHGKLDQAGIPVIECADYMEISPLARAEWMKFYGRLYGYPSRADSLFAETERQYNDLKAIAASTEGRPKVLMDRVYGQTWHLPAGNSTMGRMIEDAGATNPFGNVKESGSLSLSPEKVLYEAGDADFWLIRFAYTPVTLQSLASDKDLYPRFKAYKEGNVYGSNSSESRIFEDVAFHPQWLLGCLISIFHPEVKLPSETKSYFKKIE